MDNELEAKKHLADQQTRKFGVCPNKYILCINTPRKAYVVEGRKDFSEYHNRQATMTAWFEFLLGLSKCKQANVVNKKYRLTHFSPELHMPEDYYGLTMKHLQDGTICFGGRVMSNCANDNEDTTVELIQYFEELANIKDDQLRAHLGEFGFGIYEQ